MSKGVKDAVRQAANVLGAIFQIVAPTLAGPAIGRVSSENPTLVVPGDYAFVIWSPIFALALVYAVYQALPANRENPFLRRIGWFSALAYFSNGVWELLFPAREFALSQVVFVGIFAGAVIAFLLAQRGADPERRVDLWLIAPAFGLLAGWVTAAFFVGFATVLVATGVLNGGIGEAVLGALLLIAGGAVACAVILAGRDGPAHGYLAYGAAVLWALVGVFANQYQASLITASTAVVCALLVAAVLFVARRRSSAARGSGQPSRPRVA
jgi:hypothetical protein